MAMDAGDGGLGLGGSFVDNFCFWAIFARGTHRSEGVQGAKTDWKAFVAIIVSLPQATQIGTIEFCSQKLCLDRNEGCCAAFLERKLRAPSFPATSQCELKNEIYQTFACVPFLILDPLAAWTIN
jgi:hypothetical protein